jgi:uncharacterized membrane protein
MAKKIKDEEYWENWGEEFGKKMESWGEDFGKNMEKKFCCKIHNKFSISGFLIGLLVLFWGLTWLGNEMGWWEITFPFWPIVFVLIGLAIIINTIKNSLKK